MIDPITQKSFKEMYSRWLDVLCIKKENGIEMWPPISGAFRRVRQFLSIKNLIKGTEKKYNTKFVEIDLEEQESPDLGKIKTLISPKNNKHLGIFLLGIDSALRKSADTLKSLATVLEQNTNISALIFTEVNISENEYLTKLMPKSVLLQNLFYQPLYQKEDSIQFLRYLEDKWKFKVNKEILSKLVEVIGGHFLLLKEAARQIRKNPNVSIEEILTSPIMILKGVAIFKLLSKKDQEALIKIMNKNNHVEIADYLINTALVSQDKINLSYWEKIEDQIRELMPLNFKRTFPLNLDLLLSVKEREIFELLLDTGTIVDREEIGKIIWGNDYEDRYSEWAIDQTMHRIREKIKKAKLPFDLQTKKGLGFILLEK